METRRKSSGRYFQSFKDIVCKEYLSGLYSKTDLEKKHNIGHGRVLYWLYELGYLKKENTNLEFVKAQKSPKIEKPSSKTLSSLEKELEDVKLQLEAHKLMIDIAEKELKINIRKKSNTK